MCFCAVEIIPIPTHSKLQEREADLLLTLCMKWLCWQEYFGTIMVCVYTAVKKNQSRKRTTNHAFVFSCRNIFCDNDGISLDELVFLLALVMHACLDLRNLWTCIKELTQSASLMHDQQRFNYLAIQVWKRLQHFLNRDFHFVRAQEKNRSPPARGTWNPPHTVEPEI